MLTYVYGIVLINRYFPAVAETFHGNLYTVRSINMSSRPNKDPRTGKAYATPRTTRVSSPNQGHRRTNSLDSMQQAAQSPQSPLTRNLATLTDHEMYLQGLGRSRNSTSPGLAHRRTTESSNTAPRPVVKYSRPPQLTPSSPITITKNTSPTRPTQTSQNLCGTPPIIVQSCPMSSARPRMDASVAVPTYTENNHTQATLLGFHNQKNPSNPYTRKSSNSNSNSFNNRGDESVLPHRSAEATCRAALTEVDELSEELAEINTVISNVDSSLEKSQQLTLQCGREPGDFKLISKLTTPINNHHRFQSPAQVYVSLGKPLERNLLKPRRAGAPYHYRTLQEGTSVDFPAPTLERDCIVSNTKFGAVPATVTPLFMRQHDKSAFDAMWSDQHLRK